MGAGAACHGKDAGRLAAILLQRGECRAAGRSPPGAIGNNDQFACARVLQANASGGLAQGPPVSGLRVREGPGSLARGGDVKDQLAGSVARLRRSEHPPLPGQVLRGHRKVLPRLIGHSQASLHADDGRLAGGVIHRHHLRRVRRCFAGGVGLPCGVGHRGAYLADDVAGKVVLILRQRQNPQARY